MRMLPTLTGMTLAVAASASAQARFELSVPKIMRGAENTGREPSQVRWSPDGRWIYFRWLPPGPAWKKSHKPYRVRALPGSEPERLSPAAADSLEPLAAEGPLSANGKRRGVSVRGGLFLIELPPGEVR